MSNNIQLNEAQSLVRLLKRNLAEHRMQRTAAGVDVVFEVNTKQTIDDLVRNLELTLDDLSGHQVAQEPVVVERVQANFPSEVAAQPAAPEIAEQQLRPVAQDEPVAQAPADVQVTRSAANTQRDTEIKERMLQAQAGQKPVQKPVSAVGANRDTVTRVTAIHHPSEAVPEEERRTNNLILPEIPGTNMRPVSPYDRLTNPEFSEFARLFSQSPFTQDCNGFITCPSPKFKWHAEYNIQGMQPLDIVRLPQGFYGRSAATGGPEYVMVRTDKAAVLWNLKHGNDNVHIFYIGRSNKTGYWYKPADLSMEEMLSVVVGIAEQRKRLEAELAGKVYAPTTRIRD